MSSDDDQLKKGNTRALLLAALADAPRHGYAIAREIERRSGDALSLNEGALYPALRALEREGFVVGNWEPQPSGPARRIYALTEEGRAELTRLVARWRSFNRAIESVFGTGEGGAVPDAA